MSEPNGVSGRRRSRGNGANALFADGTAPGGRSVSTALKEALDALAALERILTAEGGYMTPTDQDALRRARFVLQKHGVTR